jgi:glycosyltransferase involved in cell wall biosynthesis/GT2 family glycosyltransferase
VHRPLDWTRGAGRPPAERASSVDVIIPVCGAAEELRACLASVVEHTDLVRHRLTLVIDGPQDAAVESVIAGLAVVRNEKRLGFVGSVNRGMRASSGDVVLLNSDTLVTAGWLEKLTAAAYSSGDVGTVTPLSNNATLVSVPRAFEENLLPTGFDVASYGAFIEKHSQRMYRRLPTAVGVCMYIRRAVLDDIGLFDEARFGLGYGEENDFCMRALQRGWLHIADDATFIYHAGHRSFGASRVALQRKARRALQRAHPRYMATIAAYMQAGEPLTRRVAPPSPRAAGRGYRIVHLVHGWPPFQHAGTELYAYWLVQQQKERHHVSVYTRFADASREDGEAVELLDDGVRVRLITNNFTARNPLRRNALRDRSLERDFERFLREERPDLLHIHHLAGHAFSLVKVAKRLRIPIVLQIQDWWFLCARVNLFHRDGYRCSGPAIDKCSRCAKLTRVPPAPFWNRLLHVLRKRDAYAALAACDAYVVGSNAIRDDYVRAGAIPSAHVIPYGVDIVAPAEPRTPTDPRALTKPPIRFGYVGSIAPHKGVHIAAEAMRGLDATLHAWGDFTALPEYTERLRAEGVVFEGRFREDEKQRVFASMDVLLVPSIGLESFGLAAREAMTCGVPVIASAGAALSELVGAEWVPAGDVAALRAILRRIVDDPSIVDAWRARLPRPKRSDAHAAEIEQVYESVLKR